MTDEEVISIILVSSIDMLLFVIECKAFQPQTAQKNEDSQK